VVPSKKRSNDFYSVSCMVLSDDGDDDAGQIAFEDLFHFDLYRLSGRFCYFSSHKK
jgi:hypothetical protein